MPAHIWTRTDRGGMKYLVDGRDTSISLKTRKTGLAEERLKQYLQGKFGGDGAKITIGEFYDSWMAGKREPLVRRSWLVGTRSIFKKHILPEFKGERFANMTLARVEKFRTKLIDEGRTIKTAANVMSKFRRLWKAARKQGIAHDNPFELMDWPALTRSMPDPFTPAERDTIIARYKEHDFFYFPLIYLLFATGMRPSEASALLWSDVDLEAGTISITKSRNLRVDAAPKTRQSFRVIRVAEDVTAALRALPSRNLGAERLFINKWGAALDINSWAAYSWQRTLKTIGIRARKFYAMRHTHITECVKARYDLLSIARYHGTSIKMIEDHYCGALEMRPTVLQPEAPNYAKTIDVDMGALPVDSSVPVCVETVSGEKDSVETKKKSA